MKKVLKEFGIIPNDIYIYYQAFTHQTFVNEKKSNFSYQRLEFVGDAIIDAEVSIFLYKNYPKLDEGQMTLLRAKCVDKVSFAQISQNLKLGKLLRVGNGGEILRENQGILADLFESFSAAIYLDQGRTALLALLKSTVFKKIKIIVQTELKDSKTRLQELLQTESRESIKYEIESKNGYFISTIIHEGNIFGRGKGISKKESEQNAAKNALSKLKGSN